MKMASPTMGCCQTSSSLFYWFKHPFLRLFVCVFVCLLNLLIYLEDPVAHSNSRTTLPVAGDAISLIFSKWPPHAGLAALKAALGVTGIVLAVLLGRGMQRAVRRLLVWRYQVNLEKSVAKEDTIMPNPDHKLTRLQTSNDGTWMLTFISLWFVLFGLSKVYNVVVHKSGLADKNQWTLSEDFGLSNKGFMKAAATGTWLGDFMTSFMVVDSMLQELQESLGSGKEEGTSQAKKEGKSASVDTSNQRSVTEVKDHFENVEEAPTGQPRPHPSMLYLNFAKRRLSKVLSFWLRFRVLVFWTSFILLSSLVLFFVHQEAVFNWKDVAPFCTSEIGRTFLAGFILTLDICIVFQDWSFPSFLDNFDIKIPGLAVRHIKSFMKRNGSGYWISIHISGKWFNYGILFFVILLDLNMLKNQVLYQPEDFCMTQLSDRRLCVLTKTRDGVAVENLTECVKAVPKDKCEDSQRPLETLFRGDIPSWAMLMFGLPFVVLVLVLCFKTSMTRYSVKAPIDNPKFTEEERIAMQTCSLENRKKSLHPIVEPGSQPPQVEFTDEERIAMQTRSVEERTKTFDVIDIV